MTKEARLGEYLLRLRIYTNTKYIQKRIEKEVSQKSQATDGLSMKQVVGHFNPLPDENRGFRALALAITGNQEQYKLLKAKVIAILNKKNVFYQQIFGSFPSSKPSSWYLCNETSLDSRDNWFQFPEMVKLAADTFNRVITCYTLD
ncbi:hypothetical protein PS6_001107 [Mucor atramentarius]